MTQDQIGIGRYVKDGDLDVDAVVKIVDVTAQARALENVDVRPLIASAKKLKSLADVPTKDMLSLIHI